MVKLRKLIVILMALVISSALLMGCGSSEEEVTIPEDNIIEQETGDENGSVVTGDAKTQVEDSAATVSGKLKTVNADASTVTIATDGGDELELKITGESKIFIGDSSATIDDIGSKTDAEVKVEYLDKEKTVTSITVQN